MLTTTDGRKSAAAMMPMHQTTYTDMVMNATNKDYQDFYNSELKSQTEQFCRVSS